MEMILRNSGITKLIVLYLQVYLLIVFCIPYHIQRTVDKDLLFEIMTFNTTNNSSEKQRRRPAYSRNVSTIQKGRH